jgi:hypothetical protein
MKRRKEAGLLLQPIQLVKGDLFVWNCRVWRVWDIICDSKLCSVIVHFTPPGEDGPIEQLSLLCYADPIRVVGRME